MKKAYLWILPLAAIGAILVLNGSYAVSGGEPPEGKERPESDSSVIAVPIEPAENEAAENSVPSEENPFEGLKPTDNIIPLEDGGFLVGTGEVKTFTLDDLENPIDVIDLDNHPDAITPEEAYSLFQAQ